MFCSNCGNKINENSTFCSECGKKIGTTSSLQCHHRIQHVINNRIFNSLYGFVSLVSLFLAILIFTDNPTREREILVSIILLSFSVLMAFFVFKKKVKYIKYFALAFIIGFLLMKLTISSYKSDYVAYNTIVTLLFVISYMPWSLGVFRSIIRD